MNISIDLGGWNGIFAVPVSVVDEHLRLANAGALRVLLYLLRHAGESVETETLCSVLKIEPFEAEDAVSYWVSAGIFKRQENVLKPGDAAVAQETARRREIMQVKDTAAGNVKLMTSSAPRLSNTEVAELTQKNPELQFLFQQAESILGRFFSSTDISVLASLYSWAGMPADVLLMLIEYCASQKKTTMRAIEKAAFSWLDQGIDTHDKADRYMREQKEKTERYGLVKSAFGIYDRNLTDKEREYIDCWFAELGFDISMVKLAFERTVANTGRLSMAYIHKILQSWHSKGIATTQQAAEESEKRSRRKKEAEKPTFDLEELEYFSTYNTPKI